MIRYCFLLIALLGGLQVQAQVDNTAQSPLKVGYHLFFNYNLYSWHQKPFLHYGETTSSGQVFNVLPGAGIGFWFGDIDHWTIGVEGGVEYLPFALDLDGFKGMGTLAFPLTAKVQFPVAKQNSTWLMLHVGLGAHILKTDLYAQPTTYQGFANPFYANIHGEIGLHLSAVGYHRKQQKEIEFFTRVGGGYANSIFVSTGLRITFWNTVN